MTEAKIEFLLDGFSFFIFISTSYASYFPVYSIFPLKSTLIELTYTLLLWSIYQHFICLPFSCLLNIFIKVNTDITDVHIIIMDYSDCLSLWLLRVPDLKKMTNCARNNIDISALTEEGNL